ncbi:hypothetical protein [Pontimicrobium sp. MEBiC01747]
MKQIVHKTITLDCRLLKNYEYIEAFTKQARSENWTEDEIEAVVLKAISNKGKHFVETFKIHCSSGVKKIVDKTVNLNVVNPHINAFMLVGLFKGQAKQEGWTDEEINQVIDEANSGDYNHLVATIKNHCEAKAENQ